jgi:hypothetical protein
LVLLFGTLVVTTGSSRRVAAPFLLRHIHTKRAVEFFSLVRFSKNSAIFFSGTPSC